MPLIEPGDNVQAKLNLDSVASFRRGAKYPNCGQLRVTRSGLRITAHGTGAKPHLITNGIDVSRKSGVIIEEIRAENLATPTDTGGIWGIDANDLQVLNNELIGFRMGLSIQGYSAEARNFTLIGNLIQNCYNAANKHSSGLYAYKLRGVKILRNMFDTNGWRPGKNVSTNQNHNLYLKENLNDVIVEDNFIYNGSGHGLQMRCGQICNRNLFMRNPVHLSFGLVNGSPGRPGGISGAISGCMFLGSGSVGGLTRDSGTKHGWAVSIANVNANGLMVADSICCNDSGLNNKEAIIFEFPQDLYNESQCVGILKVDFKNTKVGRWPKSPFWQHPNYSTSGTGIKKLGTVTWNGTPINTTQLDGFMLDSGMPDMLARVNTPEFLNFARANPSLAAKKGIELAMGGSVTPPPEPDVKVTGIYLYQGGTLVESVENGDTIVVTDPTVIVIVETVGAVTEVLIDVNGQQNLEKYAPWESLPRDLKYGTNQIKVSVNGGQVNEIRTFTASSPIDPPVALDSCLVRHDSHFTQALELEESRIARDYYLKG